MLTHVSSRCAGEVPSTKSSNEAASWQDLPCCVGWGTRHGSAGEGGGEGSGGGDGGGSGAGLGGRAGGGGQSVAVIGIT